MQFTYENKNYDIRFKKRYLPEGIKEVGSFDLMVLLSSGTRDRLKLALLQSYLPGATLTVKAVNIIKIVQKEGK